MMYWYYRVMTCNSGGILSTSACIEIVVKIKTFAFQERIIVCHARTIKLMMDE